MVRSARRYRQTRHRRARFELLETRQYLSANQVLTTDPGVQQMPSIAVDPLDPDHVVVAYMDYSLVDTGYAGIGVKVSRDGGRSWSMSSVPLPANFAEGAANPVIKFDNVDHDANLPGIQNRAFVSFMAATFLGSKPPITNASGVVSRDDPTQFRSFGMASNNGIFVSASDDGGLNWKNAATVSSQLFDGQNRIPFDIMPDLAVDMYQFLPDGTTPNPNYGNVYTIWSRYFPIGQYPGEPEGGSGSNIMFAVSEDGGATWQTRLESQPAESPDPITVIYTEGYFSGFFPEGLGLENWSHVTVGPEGDIYVSHFLGGQFAVHHSTNAGVSFAHPNSSNNELFPFNVNVPTVPGVLSNNNFRLQSVRAIVADPLRPGHVYVAETNPAIDPQGNTLDEDEIIFARSTDYGRTWQKTFTVGAKTNANVINDENDGRSPTGAADDVSAAQFMPRLVADRNGNLAVIWYDTRRDPLNHRIDVFGAISSDGGLSFSPNFRLTDESFDADDGMFTDARGNPTFYLGDFLGMALGGGSAYAVWADTRDGNQNIEFATFSLTAPPPPINDRYEDNNTSETATDLARVVERDLPKLTMVQGESDWFKLQTASTGTLTVTGTLVAGGENVRVELFRMIDGNLELVAAGTASGLATEVSVPSGANQDYWVRVTSGRNAPADSSVRYTLSIKSLTANLGTRAYGSSAGEQLQVGDDLYYALTAAAGGSIRVGMTPAAGFQGNVRLELLDPATLDVVARGALGADELAATLPVAKGQKLYVHVIGDAASQGSFAMTFTNFDQFTTDDNGSVFYPTGIGPSESALADLNGDKALDIVVSHVGQNIVSVLLNNGDGTYQSPREYAIGAFQQGGPFTIQGLQNFHRDIAIANFNPKVDNFLDIVVVNTSSSDISVLLGNGDGTFRPHRRFDATAAPFAMAVGDVNKDGVPDVVVIDSTADRTAQGAVLLGRGDGTFQLPKAFALPNREPNRTNSILLIDVNGDGNLDLVERDFLSGTTIFSGNGDGTFRLNASPILGPNGPGIDLVDLDRDGDLDVVITQNNGSNVIYTLRNADGTYSEPTEQFVGQFPVAVQVVDMASVLADGTVVVGTRDGRPDLVVANNGYTLPSFAGPAEVVIMAGLTKGGAFAGFSDPVRLAPARGPLDVKVEDINGDLDKFPDVVLLDRDGVLIVYGQEPPIDPNETLATARDLGAVVHMIQPTLTIVPGHANDYYKLTVPTEAFTRAGNQVLDFSAGFVNEEGAGLVMQVLDSAGNILATGDRLRLEAEQGDELFVRIFAADDQSAGAYTLVVNTLPQVAAIEAHSLLPGIGELPGGPTTSLVLVFQGDRLDMAAAEKKENYKITWLGNDGVVGGGDDRVIEIGANLPQGSKAVVYNPSRNNVDAASGRSIPTAFRQTVTLLFGEPLPAGNYVVQVDGEVMSSSFNVGELDLLSPLVEVVGHPVVSIADNGEIVTGFGEKATDLVLPAGALDLTGLEDGTSPLTQSHSDLGRLLDSLLTDLGDNPNITERLLLQIIAIIKPGLIGADGLPIVNLAVAFFDPTSIGLVAPDGATLNHDLGTNTFTSNLRQTFVEVGGNIELIVIANPVGEYELSLADVPARARAGVVYFGREGPKRDTFTEALRSKTLATTFVADEFRLNVRYVAPVTPRIAASSVVAFVAPTFLPTFVSTSLVTSAVRFNAVTPNLLLTTAIRANSVVAQSALLATFGSGGSPVRSLVRAAEEAWDVVFSGWDRITNLFDDSPLADETDDKRLDEGDSPAAPTLEQAWQTFSHAISEMFTPADAPAAAVDAEQQTSKSRDGDATTDQADADGNSPEQADASASSTPPVGNASDKQPGEPTANTEPPTTGPAETSAEVQKEGSHATAA